MAGRAVSTRAGKSTRRSGGAAGGKHVRRRGGRATAGRRREGKGGRGGGGAAAVVKALARPLRKGEGCVAAVAVGEQAGDDCDHASNICEIGGALRGTTRVSKGAGSKGGRRRTGRGGGRLAARTCRAVAAVGHAVRGAILVKLLEGPATYRALKRLTKAKPGPLYHHINQLRLAGLVMPKQRDLYELTRGGRNLILVLMAVEPLTRDSRRRPQPAKSS